MIKKKGSAGYISFQHIYTILRTLLLFASAFGIFALGYFTLHTRKNLWTILAILCVLPAAKSAVNMIMFLRFHSLKITQRELIEKTAGEVPLLWDNILTTPERAYYLPVIAYSNHSLITYLGNRAKEPEKIKEHLNECLKLENLTITVKLFESEAAFLKRLDEIGQKYDPHTDAESADAVFQTIRAI